MPFPGPSDHLRTHGVLADSLRLTWSAPASTSAVPVLGYQVSAQAGGTSGFAVVVVDTGSAATQAHVSGLHPGCWCAALTAHAPARTPLAPGANLVRCGACTSYTLFRHRGVLTTSRYEFRVAARTEGGLGAMSTPSPPVQMARNAGAARSLLPLRPRLRLGLRLGLWPRLSFGLGLCSTASVKAKIRTVHSFAAPSLTHAPPS